MTTAWILTMSLAATASAGPAHTPGGTAMLETPASLAASLDDPALVLLHVGDEADYRTAHIRGARYVSLRDISINEGPLVLQMPAPDDLRQRLEGLGISDDSRVVVYYATDWVSPATRVVFTLQHAGLDRVALLDGGMRAWTAAGHPVSDAAPPARRGRLTRATARHDVADATYIQANIGKPGFALIDARDPAFYSGERPGGPRDLRVPGHITGAVSVPFSTVATPDPQLKPRAELETLFREAGVKPGDTVVTYCHIGQQATAVAFAARTLGYKVLLYDGSFEDWVRRGLPVTDPSRR